MALAAPAVAVGPPPVLDQTTQSLGQTVSQVGRSLPKLPSTPLVKSAPKPAPAQEAPAAPRPAASAPSPAPAAEPSAAPAARERAPATRPAPTPRAHASATPSKASGGTASPDPTDAAQADSAGTSGAEAGAATATTSSTSGDASSLPFTGSTLLPVALLAVALAAAGVALRRAVRVRT